MMDSGLVKLNDQVWIGDVLPTLNVGGYVAGDAPDVACHIAHCNMRYQNQLPCACVFFRMYLVNGAQRGVGAISPSNVGWCSQCHGFHDRGSARDHHHLTLRRRSLPAPHSSRVNRVAQNDGKRRVGSLKSNREGKQLSFREGAAHGDSCARSACGGC